MNFKDLKQYEKYFYRAPSAHNTQPWVLTYQDEVIFLNFDPNRSLPQGDPTNRDLLLSLGAFVETVLIVTSHFGCPLEFMPHINLAERYIGIFTPHQQSYKTDFTLKDVERRQTSRLNYQKDAFDRSVLEELGRQSSGFRIHSLESLSLIDLFKLSDEYVFHQVPIVKELRCWLRLNKNHPGYFTDGLNAECLNLDPFQAGVFHWILKSLEFGIGQRLKLDKLLTFSSIDIAKHNCLVLLLTGTNKNDLTTLEAGRALQRIWLALGQKGYFTHPVSQIIDCPRTYALLSSRIDLKEQEQIFSIFRVGVSNRPAYSRRLIS